MLNLYCSLHASRLAETCLHYVPVMNHSQDSDYPGCTNKACKANAWIVPQNVPRMVLFKASHLLILSFDAYKFRGTDNC